MFDDLEALLKSAKREAYERKSTTPKLISAKFIIKRQAELEWERGQTVCLIHRAPDGTETALGLFVEYLRNGSRWLRPTTETLSPHHSEIVTGSWWLNPSIREIPLDSPSEVTAIRARFEMLMDEFDKLYPPIEAHKSSDDFEDFDDEEDYDDDEDSDFEDDEEDDE